MGYFKATVKGIWWTIALRASVRLLTLLRIIILARFFLTPEQFGLFGLVAIVLALLEISSETGINVFLIQENSRIKEYVDTAWVVSIIRGFFLAALILATSTLVSSFFNSPKILSLLLLSSVIPFIKGFINPSEVKFQKDLTFHKEFYFQSLLFLVETLTLIVVAFLTRSAIAFVLGLIASGIAEVIGSFLFITPRPRFIFNIQKVKNVLHRGKWVTLSGIFGYLAQEGDNFVVGKVMGASPLGIYQTGYKFSTLPVSEVTDVISKVVFPVYSKFQGDTKRLKKAFLKTSGVIIVGSIILASLIVVFRRPIVLYTLGNEWIQMTTILPILAIYGVLRAIFGSASAIFLAAKRQDYVAAMTFLRFLGLGVTIVPLTIRFGLIGASYSALISVLIEIPVIIYLITRLFKN